MQTDSLTIYKLMVLYMLEKVDFPLTNSVVTNFILEKDYTNYFNIQKAISELIEADLISVESTQKSSYYKCTNSGKETLSLFRNHLSSQIREDITEYLKSHKYEILEDLSTTADYTKNTNNEYLTHCKVMENETIIMEVCLSVPTEDEANNICRNFRNKSQEIYAFLMQTLMQLPKEEDENK